MHGATRSSRPTPAVDNTDWLKAAAIVLVSVDHFGYFFMEDDLWWSAFGRLAAPIFFFLLGFAQSRTVPLHWIWLGVVLTLLESWNADWTWVVPNILLSLALIRFARPYVQILLIREGWAGFFLLVCGLLAVLPITSKIVDYGSAGWLWALCGLCQRMYVDGRTIVDAHGTANNSSPLVRAMTENVGLMRLLACVVAAVVYVWQEQTEYAVSSIPSRRFHSRNRCFVRQPVSVPARPEPCPTAGSHSRFPAFHRPAHSGNLCYPACWLRTPCQVGARSRFLIKFS